MVFVRFEGVGADLADQNILTDALCNTFNS